MMNNTNITFSENNNLCGEYRYDDNYDDNHDDDEYADDIYSSNRDFYLKLFDKDLDNLVEETNNKILEEDGWDYNCGGFALGTFEWLELSSFKVFNYLKAKEILLKKKDVKTKKDRRFLKDYRKKINRNTKECVEELLKNYDFIRIIKKTSELKPNEYAFTFRRGDDDFHFIRRFSNGVWTHKPGSMSIRKMETKEVFSKEWEHGKTPYCSKLYMFACEAQ